MKYIAIALFVFVPTVLISIFFLSDKILYAREFRVANTIIARTASFKYEHGRLPATLGELGIKDDSPGVFYDKQSADAFTVWFGTSLGECMTYDSRTKKWDGICGVRPATRD